MIGKLKGMVDTIGEDWVIVDVGGVGYVVQCSTRTLGGLPGAGEPVSLSIETYVRQDQIKLFGFGSDEERNWFNLLLSVQGVGTKVALAILSTLAIAELAGAISVQDKVAITRSPGVGAKVATRIVTELKDKVPAFSLTGAGVAPAGGDDADGPARDAVSALTNLGYPHALALRAIAGALKDAGGEATASDLIKIGLKELSA
jgi:Holliday junction DNA helicase RuvA